MPVGVEIWSDACRELADSLRLKFRLLQLIDMAGVSLYLGVQLSDAPLVRAIRDVN